jgi:hypothetical protein
VKGNLVHIGIDGRILKKCGVIMLTGFMGLRKLNGSLNWLHIYFTYKDDGKVVPVLLTEHHAMKAYWGVEV